MTERSGIPRRIMIAAAAGDVETLAALAIELNGELFAAEATVAELRRADDDRREKQAERKRRSRGASLTTSDTPGVCHVTSRDGTGQSGTERDVTTPLPPAPSLSSPRPLINPSSPPIPASSTAAPAVGTPEAEAEARLLVRFTDPTDRAGIERFLGYAADVVKRVAWAGRLGALLDKPPHFTPPELAEGLEALLTQDVGTWGPALLKVWVGRVRTEAGREALAAAEAKAGVGGRSAAKGADAAAAWEYVSGDLLRKQVQRTITMDDLGALGPRSRAALRAVGGMPGLAQKPERDMPFARRDFLAAFALAEPAQATQPSHLDGAAA